MEQLVTEEGLPPKPGLDVRVAYFVRYLVAEQSRRWVAAMPFKERLMFEVSHQVLANFDLRERYVAWMKR